MSWYSQRFINHGSSCSLISRIYFSKKEEVVIVILDLCDDYHLKHTCLKKLDLRWEELWIGTIRKQRQNLRGLYSK